MGVVRTDESAPMTSENEFCNWCMETKPWCVDWWTGEYCYSMCLDCLKEAVAMIEKAQSEGAKTE